MMKEFKNNPNFNLYYTDTDSIVINHPLPDEMVGPELGQFKLEYEITDAIFLAPKVYGIITTDGEQILKVKGLTKEVVSTLRITDLETLLVKEATAKFSQLKWNKNLFKGNISVLETAYKLRATNNKRDGVYKLEFYPDGTNCLNVLHHTIPYNYDQFNKYNDQDT